MKNNRQRYPKKSIQKKKKKKKKRKKKILKKNTLKNAPHSLTFTLRTWVEIPSTFQAKNKQQNTKVSDKATKERVEGGG